MRSTKHGWMTSSVRGGRVLRVVVIALAALLATATSTAGAAARPNDGSPAPAVAVASTATAPLVQPAAPYPPGTPGPFRIQNPATGLCLDSNQTEAYFGRCHASDTGQRWGWWNGGWLINLHTGKCVGLRGRPSLWFTEMEPCVNNSTQYWVHRNQAIVNLYTGQCIPATVEADPAPVWPCETTRYQTWRVQYW